MRPPDARQLAGVVKTRARNAGFDLVGIAEAERLTTEHDHFIRWLEEGYGAEMEWLARDPHRRSDPRRLLDGCRSVIVVGVNYFRPDTERSVEGGLEARRGRIARYARFEDYHLTMGKRLRRLVGAIREEAGVPFAAKWYVDTGPVLEKVWAQRAGLGFIGKNTCLINSRRGSWLLLGVILTSLDLSPDPPARSMCGTCRSCIDACPTGALSEPGVLDARRCLSYLTIEHRGRVEPDLAASFDGWLFGCDICQEVCPFNGKFQRPAAAGSPLGKPIHPAGLPLREILDLKDGAEFIEYVGTHSPLRRAGLDGIVRTARILQENRSRDR